MIHRHVLTRIFLNTLTWGVRIKENTSHNGQNYLKELPVRR